MTDTLEKPRPADRREVCERATVRRLELQLKLVGAAVVAITAVVKLVELLVKVFS